MGRAERPADREADGAEAEAAPEAPSPASPLGAAGRPAGRAGNLLRTREELPPPGRLSVRGAWKGAGNAGSRGRSRPLKRPPRAPRPGSLTPEPRPQVSADPELRRPAKFGAARTGGAGGRTGRRNWTSASRAVGGPPPTPASPGGVAVGTAAPGALPGAGAGGRSPPCRLLPGAPHGCASPRRGTGSAGRLCGHCQSLRGGRRGAAGPWTPRPGHPASRAPRALSRARAAGAPAAAGKQLVPAPLALRLSPEPAGSGRGQNFCDPHGGINRKRRAPSPAALPLLCGLRGAAQRTPPGTPAGPPGAGRAP